ncbi:MAG: ChaN family lipoprotein [Planctomycetes bacterium]|nr:ChaN family lipoprotein [Planctomycetota bacterium]
MRSSIVVVPLLLAACAMPRVVGTVDDHVEEVRKVGAELATADAVALGEHHRTPSVHRTHLALIEAMHEKRPNMVIAMEMFERDVQVDLDQYLGGVIDEATFRERSRPWPDYDVDYRPVIEFAKANGIVVLAANAPRPLASRVAKEGLDAVADERGKNVAREISAPKDAYWDAFVDEMEESMAQHGGNLSPATIERFYAAQCLKDDTMAESIADYLHEHGGETRPLAVLICGKMHSDYRRGAVQRLHQRMPELDIRVLSVEVVDDLSSGLYASRREVADWVIVTDEHPPEPKIAAKVAAKPGAKMPDDSVHKGAGERSGEAPMDTEGLRPALGLMPDYGSGGDGVLVAIVREGGPADLGGMKSGDLIVELGGEKVADVEEYTDVLDMQQIGKPVKVKVKRGEETLELEVVVTSRSR